MKRIALLAVILFMGVEAHAQSTVEPGENGLFYLPSGTATLRLEVRNQCSLPATVSLKIRPLIFEAAAVTVTKAVAAKGITAFDQEYSFKGADSEVTGLSFSFDVETAHGEPTIVEGPPGVCKKVSVACAPQVGMVLFEIMVRSKAPVLGGVLRRGIVLDDEETSEPVSCSEPKTDSPADDSTGTTGLGELFTPLPIDDPNRPPVVDEDDVFGGGSDAKPEAPKSDPPKNDPPKSDAPKSDAPKSDSRPSDTVARRLLLNARGTFEMHVNVTSQCDAPQVVNLKLSASGGDTFGESTAMVSKGETKTMSISFRPMVEDALNLYLHATHALTTTGNKVCEAADATTEAEAIFFSDPEYKMQSTGRLGEPATLQLVQRDLIGSEPEKTVPVSPLPPSGGDVGYLPDPGAPDPDDCSDANGCIPFDYCTNGTCGGESYAPPGAGLDDMFQLIMGEMNRIQIAVSSLVDARPPRAMNPLGLLARSASEFIEWWMPKLHAAETELLIEQAGLKKGLQFIINSQGGSTGKNLTMQVLNFTGKPVSLQGALALEPLKKDAQQKTMQAFSRLAGRSLPTKVDLNGYCLEFLKLPPLAGQVLSVAPAALQKKFAPMKRLMTAANRLSQTGALKPDTTPATYADSIKQWAIWTSQEKFNQSKFRDAFVSHTKKNVEAAGQKWSKQIEDLVRERVPGRWNDIVQILKGAGAPVPQ